MQMEWKHQVEEGFNRSGLGNNTCDIIRSRNDLFKPLRNDVNS